MRPSIIGGMLFATVASLTGCSSSNGCLSAIPTATACPANVYVDASVNDPVCLTSSGVPYCRGDVDAICYVCTGASFPDNCLMRSSTETLECVHSCSKC
jgi:hypothetical protein